MRGAVEAVKYFVMPSVPGKRKAPVARGPPHGSLLTSLPFAACPQFGPTLGLLSISGVGSTQHFWLPTGANPGLK